jgi:NAD(P) transhydrogenase subunit alpha
MKIGIPKETVAGETRIAMFPSLIAGYKKDGHSVLIQSGAGDGASFSDEMLATLGAEIVPDASKLFSEADILFKVQPPTPEEAAMFREGSSFIGFLGAFTNHETVKLFVQRRITSYAMEMIPRITRAQSMDALSSMATVGGYKSVLLAADHIHKMFPLMMTAAGTVTPATVLILGAGVAGLQAIATARRLGAKVEAFDPRPAVKEQVKSLGASFVEMEMPKDAETAGGYAKELSPEFIQKEMEAIGGRLPKVDVVICTAQVFGKRAPLLITADMVKMLRPGSIIVDLAAEQGGNCELTQAGKTIVEHGVKILGVVNLPATMPLDASQLYAKNVQNLFKLLYPKADSQPDFNDEIVKGCCVTRGGEIVNEAIKKALG